MAATPSYNCIPIALLIVFATVSLNLLQSAAIRAEEEGAMKSHVVVAAPAHAPRGPPIELKGMFEDFPCFPFLPKILRDLCHALFNPLPPSPPPPPRMLCRSPLKKRLVPPCTGFLTNSSVPEPPPKSCCDAVLTFMKFDGSGLPYCLCHVANGDIGELLPAPLNRSRTITVLSECDIGLDADAIANVCKNVNFPPMDPTPPPSPEKKA